MDEERSPHDAASEEALVNEVHRRGDDPNTWLASRQMELTRRNIVALREFNASSDKWSKRIVVLTVALAVLTVLLAVIAIETAYLTWVLLEHEIQKR